MEKLLQMLQLWAQCSSAALGKAVSSPDCALKAKCIPKWAKQHLCSPPLSAWHRHPRDMSQRSVGQMWVQNQRRG